VYWAVFRIKSRLGREVRLGKCRSLVQPLFRERAVNYGENNVSHAVLRRLGNYLCVITAAELIFERRQTRKRAGFFVAHWFFARFSYADGICRCAFLAWVLGQIQRQSLFHYDRGIDPDTQWLYGIIFGHFDFWCVVTGVIAQKNAVNVYFDARDHWF
jgi:hypothetical protein